MTEVTVTASKTYGILIENQIMSTSGRIIRAKCGGERACVVCGDLVRGLHGGALEKTLTDAGYEVNFFTYPHGEKSKDAATYVSLLNFMAENGFSRSDIVIALGGGVTGDLAGFAAATYMRGVRFIQIPTTLLSMIDSSIGGKTGIDLPAGKNLAGAFWQPELVICDPALLGTLGDGVLLDGCAEAVKYAVLAAPKLLWFLRAPKENIERIIETCVAIKRDYVELDEFDAGERQKLNLGHTVGHAVEKLSDYTVTHGRAVSIGLAVISRAAAADGECTPGAVETILSTLRFLGLPTRADYTAEELTHAMLSDKKRSGGKINLIIPHDIGDCGITAVPVDGLKEYIAKGL